MRHQRPELRRWGIALLAFTVMSALGAATAVASHSFTDVPDDQIFHDDIAWMKDNRITIGCNPPANTNYCPDDFTTRGQMAAFFHRFAQAGVVDADTLDGLDSTDFLQKDEVDELGGVQGPPGPAGPPGDPAEISTQNVTIREASDGSGLIAVGNTYTALCEPGEVAIGGGYEATFSLVNLDDLSLPIIGSLPLGIGDITDLLSIDLVNLQGALNGVSNVSVHSSTPVQVNGDWGWQIGTTANVLADITVRVVCAG